MNHKTRHKTKMNKHGAKRVRRGRSSRAKGRAWSKKKSKRKKVGTRKKLQAHKPLLK